MGDVHFEKMRAQSKSFDTLFRPVLGRTRPQCHCIFSRLLYFVPFVAHLAWVREVNRCTHQRIWDSLLRIIQLDLNLHVWRVFHNKIQSHLGVSVFVRQPFRAGFKGHQWEDRTLLVPHLGVAQN